MKKGSRLCCLFGDFERDLRRQVECGRQYGGTSLVSLRESRGLKKSLIGITIRLHQFAKPPANLTQPMFDCSLHAESRPHDPQRSRERSHQGRNRAAGRKRSRGCHRLQQIRERLHLQIDRLLFERRDMPRRLAE